MRIALAQVVAGSDPVENLDIIARETERAAADGADLVVFPEAVMCRFAGPDLAELAQPTDGEWAGEVRRIARDAGVTVVVGMFTPAATADRVRNTLLVTGGVEARYDKIHLYDAFGYRESDAVEPGEHPVVFDLGDVRIGVATCYDVRFPELFRALADDGAQLVIVCASWGSGPGKREHWELLTRARALDTTSVVVAVGQADPRTIGRDDGVGAPTGIGYSGVIGADGADVVRLGDAPDTVVVDLADALAAVPDTRAKIPVLANGHRV
ncbi:MULTISPECIES: carbon-nitrogen hydrolase family protein [Microbacterium]|jgi:predicted amidohydrolase|uniref:carbon-nitrogen hydrolase family protein n=1 Tax=Microbacterium TaxID=33882 RepID=UPI0023D9F885|nr:MULTISPECIES: carbon-nitrogen hydrolase family protein [Microbacterium]MDF2046711.1 carbon-nitrogen hydrolase family protein [Microbacterium sp. Kw_RZR3]MDF2916798.1 nitrilase/cyanide hydratase and apolipoprotein N-acyltransferase [Microbacterium sp.]MDQ1075634.1 putative amidohydrolase [Microbacterium sp. SORGH_AS_0969]MDQ1115875.1 putative amidohydrolase [Microbacterium testaceum]